MDKTAFVVLGAHRSGTSAMAGVLAMCGAQPPNDPLPPASDNERGFWESASVMALNDLLLSGSGSSWDDVFAGRNPMASSAELVASPKADAILTRVFEAAPVIVLKDPRINVLLPFWQGALQAHDYAQAYVLMVRSPLEAAQSLLRRDGIPMEQGLLLWLDAMLAAERGTRGRPRVFITFDQLLADWRACLGRVEAMAGASLPCRTPAMEEAVERYLAPPLRHHRQDGAAFEEWSQVGALAAAAFDWFTRCAAGHGEGNPEELKEVQSKLDILRACLGTTLTRQRMLLSSYVRHAEGLQELVEHLQAELGSANVRVQTLEGRLGSAARAFIDGAHLV